MRKFFKTAIATAITVLSFNVNAEAMSPFTFIEYSIGTIDYDGNDLSDDGDYEAFSGSLELQMLIVPLLSIERLDFNGYHVTKIGAGSYLQFGGSSHIYALAHYNDYSGGDDGDLSLTAGVRHTFTENIEGNASIAEYTDRDGLDGYKLSLAYYFHPSFSVSGNYHILESSDVIAVAAKLSF